MIGRRDRWWVREIERINRAHQAERAELVATIAHLARQPLPDLGWQQPPTPEPTHELRLRAIADPDQLP